ncbi:MAG: Uma2 family endonuclease [Chloroflexota bacterium]
MAVLTLTKPKPIKKRWTQAEFHELPEGPPYYELEDGELIEMARPDARHQQALTILLSAVSQYTKQHKSGIIWPEVCVDITPTKTYRPDLSYLSTEHLERFENEIAIAGPPDLVVEISSLAPRDLTTKLHTYQQAGTPWYWIVVTDFLVIQEYQNTPEGYLLSQGIAFGETFSPRLFPGLSFNLAEMMGEEVKREA